MRLFLNFVLILCLCEVARAQDCFLNKPITPITNYKTALFSCLNEKQIYFLATRQFNINGQSFLFLINPLNFETSIENTACLHCQSLGKSSTWLSTPFVKALK